MQTTLGQLAALVEGSVEGDETIFIHGISSIEDAQDGDITYAENDKLLDSASRSRASAVIASASAALRLLRFCASLRLPRKRTRASTPRPLLETIPRLDITPRCMPWRLSVTT